MTIDKFELANEIARKAFPDSKHPICDMVAGVASDFDPEELLVPLDYAAQMEYNWRYYEKNN